jgi:hypothetical protein
MEKWLCPALDAGFFILGPGFQGFAFTNPVKLTGRPKFELEG